MSRDALATGNPAGCAHRPEDFRHSPQLYRVGTGRSKSRSRPARPAQGVVGPSNSAVASVPSNSSRKRGHPVPQREVEIGGGARARSRPSDSDGCSCNGGGESLDPGAMTHSWPVSVGDQPDAAAYVRPATQAVMPREEHLQHLVDTVGGDLRRHLPLATPRARAPARRRPRGPWLRASGGGRRSRRVSLSWVKFGTGSSGLTAWSAASSAAAVPAYQSARGSVDDRVRQLDPLSAQDDRRGPAVDRAEVRRQVADSPTRARRHLLVAGRLAGELGEARHRRSELEQVVHGLRLPVSESSSWARCRAVTSARSSELGAAREPVSENDRAGRGVANGRQELLLGDRDRHLVVPLLDAEVAGEAAAAGRARSIVAPVAVEQREVGLEAQHRRLVAVRLHDDVSCRSGRAAPAVGALQQLGQREDARRDVDRAAGRRAARRRQTAAPTGRTARGPRPGRPSATYGCSGRHGARAIISRARSSWPVVIQVSPQQAATRRAPRRRSPRPRARAAPPRPLVGREVLGERVGPQQRPSGRPRRGARGRARPSD